MGLWPDVREQEKDKMSTKNQFVSGVVFAIVPLFVGVFDLSIVHADIEDCDERANNSAKKLLECVTLEGVRAHQAEFQAIADANGGTRAAGTPGYEDSVWYVADTLAAAGYDVELNAFEFTYMPPAILEQIAPFAASYQTGNFTGSGIGTVTASVVPVDLALGNGTWPADPSTSTSGCEPADFVGFPAGGIALIQRGLCQFSEKAANAEAAGAAATIIFNQGNDPSRLGLIVGNASTFPDGSPSNLTKPLVGASFASGAALSELGSIALVTVDPPEQKVQHNVLAELAGKNADNVVMAGANLDSVQASPGIQDNGSGSAALLETAVQMARVKPINTVRFAWWGAQESGLLGSIAYVGGLDQEQQDRIALYLNFDQIGSPNYVYFIYDGDDSDGVGAGPGPEGSAQIEALFESFYQQRGLPFRGSDFDGRGDYGVFVAAGIPSGGLFTGAEAIKTAEEAAIWGGTAGQQYNPCYHLACDTYDNISLEALDVNSDAVAFSVLRYALNTRDINGVRGRGNFGLQPMPQQ